MIATAAPGANIELLKNFRTLQLNCALRKLTVCTTRMSFQTGFLFPKIELEKNKGKAQIDCFAL